MIKKFLLSFSLTVVTLLLLTFSMFLANDYFQYKSIMRSTYTTPWYDNNWFKQPYTLYQISKHKNKIYETKNVVGDKWVVKETNIKGKLFWTVLVEIPKETK